MPEVNGTCYHEWTDPQVIAILEDLRAGGQNGNRVRIHYGDRVTGADWMDTRSVTGRIDRSTGKIKIPLLMGSARSGGYPIITECLVRIRSIGIFTHDLWRHPDYHLNSTKAAQTLSAIGERAFIRHFGQDELDTVKLRTTLLDIYNQTHRTMRKP
jgi:hypothetical protein